MRPSNDLVLSGGQLGHERGKVLEIFMEAPLRGLMAGGLIGLKDEGIEDAGERAEDTGTATLKSLLEKRGGHFVTTLRRVEPCMTR